MPTATIVNGKTDYGAEPPTLDLRPVGSTGVRDYEIDTPDIEAAAIASGLPIFGESWGSGLAALTAQNIKMKRINSHPVAGGDPVGRCWARVFYQAPGLVNSTSAGFPGLQYTRINSTTTTILQRADIRLTSANSTTVNTLTDPLDGETIEERYGLQIDNFRGTNRDVGLLEVEVTRFMDYEDFTTPLQAKLIKFHREQLTNDAEVTVPTVVGTTLGWTFPARTLRFNGFVIGGDTATARLTMRFLAAALDHDFRWLLVDEFFRPLGDGERQRSRIYGTGSFLGSPAFWT